MDPTKDELVFDGIIFRLYKSGHIERINNLDPIPPGTDPRTGVHSKDIIISPQSGLSARIFLPLTQSDPNQKLPILIFIHGGAFCVGSPYSPLYHNHVASLTAQANVVALSIDYRRAPEHPLPTAFEDGWEAIRWVASHNNRNGPESWLNDHVNFEKVFVAGDSAGATISQNVVRRAGVELDSLDGLRIDRMILFHPFFGNNEPDKILEVIFPTSSGVDDPRVNPVADPKLGMLGCKKVLVFVAEKDSLRDRAWSYYQALKKSDWSGEVEIVETEEEGHVFHLFNPTCQKTMELMNKAVSFLKED